DPQVASEVNVGNIFSSLKTSNSIRKMTRPSDSQGVRFAEDEDEEEGSGREESGSDGEGSSERDGDTDSGGSSGSQSPASSSDEESVSKSSDDDHDEDGEAAGASDAAKAADLELLRELSKRMDDTLARLNFRFPRPSIASPAAAAMGPEDHRTATAATQAPPPPPDTPPEASKVRTGRTSTAVDAAVGPDSPFEHDASEGHAPAARRQQRRPSASEACQFTASSPPRGGVAGTSPATAAAAPLSPQPAPVPQAAEADVSPPQGGGGAAWDRRISSSGGDGGGGGGNSSGGKGSSSGGNAQAVEGPAGPCTPTGLDEQKVDLPGVEAPREAWAGDADASFLANGGSRLTAAATDG
ncbi:unnamed protein product, partial [Phaeothamnion confervicola]